MRSLTCLPDIVPVFIMQTSMLQKGNSRFPLIYEIIVWVVYVGFYKYSYYLEISDLPNPNYENFPHPQLMVYAFALTLYIIPFYRWLAPALLYRKLYWSFLFAIIVWFFFVPKLTNVSVSYLFMESNDPGDYDAFFTRQFTIHKIQATHLKGWDLKMLMTDFIAFSSVTLTRYAFDNERKKRLLEKENFQLQLDALKAQLHPHFLFNTLNSIYGMSLAESKDTPEYVLRLADMMRYILYDCRDAEVELGKDIAFTQNYMGMEGKRYPLCETTFIVSTTGDAEKIKIAPLLLIPFVENGFKHGAHRVKDSGFINAYLKAGREQLVFTVENDIFAETVDRKEPGGVGIENVKKRLQLYYPGRHDLEIENNGKTFKVTLTILFNPPI